MLRKLAWKATLDIGTTLIMLTAAATVLWFQFNPRASTATPPGLLAPKQPLSIAGAVMDGSKTAEVVLIMYSDFQCPFCRRFAQEVLPKVEEEYVSTDRLLLAFRHFPLEQIHSRANDLAVAAECAGTQGRFWEMHDYIFAQQPGSDETGLVTAAPSLDINAEAFSACTRDGKVLEKVKQDVEFGRKLGITGTPSFFLGKRLPNGDVKISTAFSGAKDLDEFRKVIDRELH